MALEQQVADLQVAVLLQETQIQTLQDQLASTMTAQQSTNSDMDAFWLLWAATLVLLMQAGFGMLEAGAVRSKNSINILLKNFVSPCLGAIVWYLVGFAFADGTGNPFIGAEASLFALSNVKLSNSLAPNFALWFYGFTFAANAATIASGAMA